MVVWRRMTRTELSLAGVTMSSIIVGAPTLDKYVMVEVCGYTIRICSDAMDLKNAVIKTSILSGCQQK